MSDLGIKLVFAGVVVFAFGLGFIWGREFGFSIERRRAVEAGVGRYVVDPARGGEATFEYGRE